MTNELISEKVMRFRKWNQIEDRHYWMNDATITQEDAFITPDFLTDMNAAMMVVEKMREKCSVKMHTARGWWFCSLYSVPFGLDVSCSAKTLPEAICKSALKAME